MDEKVCIIGTRLKELREDPRHKMSQEALAKLLGYKNKQDINKIESKSETYIPRSILDKICEYFGCSEDFLRKDSTHYCSVEENDAMVMSRKKFVALCERLNCKEEDLLGEVNGKFVTECKEDIVSAYGVVKKGSPLQLPLCPEDYISFLHKRMRSFPPGKLCAITSILELLQDCEEDQVDTFVKISQAYFSAPLKAKVDNLREYIEYYVRNKSIPEILLSALDDTVKAKHSFLEEADWSNKEFLMPLHQNLGDFEKQSKRMFSLALKRSQVECVQNKGANKNSCNYSEAFNDGIEYLTKVIGHYLKSYVETEHLSEGISYENIKEFKKGLPKYLVHDVKKNIRYWENALKDYSQRFK